MASFTEIYHRQSYSSISPLLDGNSAAGRTVLVTGGSDGIGFAIARSFVTAQALRVIILGRRENVVRDAVRALRDGLPEHRTEVIGRICDIASFEAQDNLWVWLEEHKIPIDVLVLNAALTTGAYLKEGFDGIAQQFHLNVFGNMRMAQRFVSLRKVNAPRALLNISSFMAHSNPAPRQGTYSASKAAFASLLQHLAEEVSAEEVQIINVHPGAIMTSSAQNAGYTKDTLPWDTDDLPGNFCVWAATQAAAFLHGRFVWANWDVDELKRRRDEFEDPGFLKIGLQGAEHVDITKIFGFIAAKDGHSTLRT